jgi:hypothetical protein
VLGRAPRYGDAVGRRPSRLQLTLASLVVLGLAASVFQLLQPADGSRPLRPMVDSLRVLRSAVDSCQATVEQRRAELERYDAHVDSLRARVRGLEALDERGVPLDSYPIYRRAFDAYNDAVPDWAERADTIREAWSICLDLADTHNELADSIRRLGETFATGRQ